MKISRKEQIKSCAARLFRKRGFTATSVRDIASDMEMEAPSLYNHIKGKQEILQELLLEIAEEFTSGMRSVTNSNLKAEAKLERLVKLHIDLTIENPDVMALLTSDWIHLEEPAFSQFTRLRDKYEKEFKEILKRAISGSGENVQDVDIALFSILSTLRWLYSWYLKNKSMNPIELESQLVKTLLKGIY